MIEYISNSQRTNCHLHCKPREMADLPKIVSDEEFAKLLEEREQAERLRTRDKWDTAAINVIGEPSDGLPESTIEQKFPHVVQHLVAMSPSEACRMYLHKLIVSEREIRQGFRRS